MSGWLYQASLMVEDNTWRNHSRANARSVLQRTHGVRHADRRQSQTIYRLNII